MPPAATISVVGRTDNLPVVMQFVQDYWLTAGLPPDSLFAFELVLEEVFMNIAMHGSTPIRSPNVDIQVELAKGKVTLTVSDDGPAFNPLSVPPPDLEAPIEVRSVGGLGIHLLRQMMESVDYERSGRRNKLQMSRRVS